MANQWLDSPGDSVFSCGAAEQTKLANQHEIEPTVPSKFSLKRVEPNC
jgi:hypothetical protein